jgi:hypothetical protein
MRRENLKKFPHKSTTGHDFTTNMYKNRIEFLAKLAKYLAEENLKIIPAEFTLSIALEQICTSTYSNYGQIG